MSVYLEKGSEYPFNAVVTPKGYGLDTIQVLNTASQDFPAIAAVGQDGGTGIYKVPGDLVKAVEPVIIQGAGAVKIFPLPSTSSRVAIGLMTEEGENRNIKARLELLQGPNNVKQSIEFYCSSGNKTPFFAVFETPATGYSLRVINQYPIEFPFLAYIQAMDG